jgi:hypothetical protein
MHPLMHFLRTFRNTLLHAFAANSSYHSCYYRQAVFLALASAHGRASKR